MLHCFGDSVFAIATSHLGVLEIASVACPISHGIVERPLIAAQLTGLVIPDAKQFLQLLLIGLLFLLLKGEALSQRGLEVSAMSDVTFDAIQLRH